MEKLEFFLTFAQKPPYESLAYTTTPHGGC